MVLIQQPSSFSKVQNKCLQNFEYEKVVSEITKKNHEVVYIHFSSDILIKKRIYGYQQSYCMLNKLPFDQVDKTGVLSGVRSLQMKMHD